MKILYVTTISLTMNSFFKPHIDMLVREGHSVDIACNYKELALDKFYSELGCGFFQIDFSRSPLSGDNVRAYGQLKKLVEEGGYDIVHCHTPNAAVVTRLACRKLRRRKGLKVFYTAHGFHFFKGAPLKNWLIYFPAEWLCSFMTDTLITINKEDYALAKNHMHAKKVEHVPGVGIDAERFENVNCDRAEVRRRIGVPEDAVMLLSVGELNDNKNHQVIINAMGHLRDLDNLHYVVAGAGPNEAKLKALAQTLGLSDRVYLLGYRTDIPQLNKAADIFCFPSHREGLGLAALEAMASGVPIITSNIHGINDYSKNGITGYKCSPNDVQGFADAIRTLALDDNKRKKIGNDVCALVRKYDRKPVVVTMKQIYNIQ